jgi:hypothetical protein
VLWCRRIRADAGFFIGDLGLATGGLLHGWELVFVCGRTVVFALEGTNAVAECSVRAAV